MSTQSKSELPSDSVSLGQSRRSGHGRIGPGHYHRVIISDDAVGSGGMVVTDFKPSSTQRPDADGPFKFRVKPVRIHDVQVPWQSPGPGRRRGPPAAARRAVVTAR